MEVITHYVLCALFLGVVMEIDGRELIRNANYLRVNRLLIKKIGGLEAILLTELIDWEEYLIKEKMISDGDPFFYTHEKIRDRLGFSNTSIRRYLYALENLGLLTIGKENKLPKRNMYKLNTKTISILIQELYKEKEEQKDAFKAHSTRSANMAVCSANMAVRSANMAVCGIESMQQYKKTNINNTELTNTNSTIPRNSSFAMGDFPDGKIPKAESIRKENKYTEDKTEILFSEIENLDSNTHIPEIKKRFELKKEIQDMIPEIKETENIDENYDIYDLDLDIEYSDNEYTEINESEINEKENISTVKEKEIQETEKINKMKNTKNEFFEPVKDTIKNITPENSIISFWNKFPELSTHKNRNTKLYKKANEYIDALLDHTFVDKYEFDNNWKIDSNLRILPLKELTEKTLKSAIMDYTLCFEPEYRPENKEYLSKSIVDFIYNPVTKKSQLLFMLNHKPQLINKPDPSLARKNIPSEIASRVDNILSHKYSRINDLHRLEVYNNVLRTLKKFTEIKKLGKYQTHKSNFSYIKSIERLWLDYLSNRSKITKFDFSPDNFTFTDFIEYMENEYDVSLDTSEKNIARLQRSYEKSLQSKQKEVKLVENELNIDDLLL